MVETTGKGFQGMNRISSRIYKDKKDFQAIMDLMTKSRPADHLDDYPTKVDLEEHLASSKAQANTRLWFDNDLLIGWASVDEFRNLWWDFDSRYEEQMGVEIVEWGMACIRNRISKSDGSTLDASCKENYLERLSFLEHHGFYKTGNLTIGMKRHLTEPIPELQLPLGFLIRPVMGIQEAESIATLHRAAFGTDYMTTEKRLAMMNTSAYDPSLDLVAVAPDGTTAAYCICSINQKGEKIGSADIAATHPRFQHIGLARALLLAGMGLLKQRGIQIARLGTSKDNIAMQKTAESVGFFVDYRVLWFEKKLVVPEFNCLTTQMHWKL